MMLFEENVNRIKVSVCVCEGGCECVCEGGREDVYVCVCEREILFSGMHIFFSGFATHFPYISSFQFL